MAMRLLDPIDIGSTVVYIKLIPTTLLSHIHQSCSIKKQHTHKFQSLQNSEWHLKVEVVP
jgi:hypothetical protein